MPTDKPRLMLTLDDDLKLLIESYRVKNGIASLSQAAVELLKKGVLAEDERLHSGETYTGQELQLVRIFRRADVDLRDRVMDDLIHSVARNTYKNGRYKKEYTHIDNTNQINDVVALIQLYGNCSPETRTSVLNSLSEDVASASCENNTFADSLPNDKSDMASVR